MRRSLPDNDVRKLLADLQLPRMPTTRSDEEHNDSPPSPSLRILVVADIDLPSASALAEYALQQKNEIFTAIDIDLCIACGSFCRDDDLVPYLRGKQQGRARQRRRKSQERNYGRKNKGNESYGNESLFLRSREETSALEGLMTAALSQLESIVCRVVYCPGSTDPLTTFLNQRAADLGKSERASNTHDTTAAFRSKRLTPNSRNLHRQWLPLAPGIGCAALLYFENKSVDAVTDHSSGTKNNDVSFATRMLKSARATSSPEISRKTVTDYSLDGVSGNEFGLDAVGVSQSQDEGSDNEDDIKNMSLLAEQLMSLTSSDGYCSTLERLLTLAPAAPKLQCPIALRQQSILVTHYVNCNVDSSSSAQSMPMRDKPWSVEHSSFLQSTSAQQLLCLEIASGTGYQRQVYNDESDKEEDSGECSGNNIPFVYPPECIQSGNSHVLFPGSLRQRGDFSIVEMALQSEEPPGCNSSEGEDQDNVDSDDVYGGAATKFGDVPRPVDKAKCVTMPLQFAWRVQKVDFYQVNRFPRHP